MHAPTRHRRPRRGFSLIELMVVIGIIALLAGISFTVIGGAMDTANRAATLTTIAKINKAYQQQLRGFYLHLDEDNRRTEVLAGNFRTPNGQYAVTTDKEASIGFARKLRVRSQFPQHGMPTQTGLPLSGSSAFGFDGVADTGDELPAFRQWARPVAAGGGIGSSFNANDFTADSAELLYLIVTESTIPGAPIVDSTEYSASELGDTDEDGWTEFVDAWGQPLRFYRWPTRLVNPGGYVFGQLTADITAGGTSIDVGQVMIGTNNFGGSADFNTVISYLQGADPSATAYALIGDELIEFNGVSGNALTVTMRGALSTDAVPHTAGTLVKLAPFPDVASLLFGSVNTSVLAQDPDDRFGVMADPRNLIVDPSVFEEVLHTYSSYNAPLILSIGPDGDSGLGEPFEVGKMPPPTATTPTPSPWGNLAQPKSPQYVVNPGSSPLADNLTNHMQGLGN